MIIKRADKNDKHLVLKCLDEFTDFSNAQNPDWDRNLSTFCHNNGGELYDKLIDSDSTRIFIAIDNDEGVGILEMHKVPRLRKANYYGEIESMFVKESYRGKGVAQKLMNMAFEWAKEEGFDCIRLSSGNKLDRAHAFYTKMGFKDFGKAFKTFKFEV